MGYETEIGLVVFVPVIFATLILLGVYALLTKVYEWKRLTSSLIVGALWICSYVLLFQYRGELMKPIHQSSLEEHYTRDLAEKGYGKFSFKDPDSLKFRNIRIREISWNARETRRNLGVSTLTTLVCVSGEVNSKGGAGGYTGYKPISGFYAYDFSKRTRKEGFEGLTQAFWGDLWRRVGTVTKRC